MVNYGILVFGDFRLHWIFVKIGLLICVQKGGRIMDEKISLERILCCRDSYQLDIRHSESGKCERFFVRKDALFALITVAEKHEIEKGGYAT